MSRRSNLASGQNGARREQDLLGNPYLKAVPQLADAHLSLGDFFFEIPQEPLVSALKLVDLLALGSQGGRRHGELHLPALECAREGPLLLPSARQVGRQLLTRLEQIFSLIDEARDVVVEALVRDPKETDPLFVLWFGV